MISFYTISYEPIEINIKKTGDRDQNRPAGVGRNLAARLIKILKIMKKLPKITIGKKPNYLKFGRHQFFELFKKLRVSLIHVLFWNL